MNFLAVSWTYRVYKGLHGQDKMSEKNGVTHLHM